MRALEQRRNVDRRLLARLRGGAPDVEAEVIVKAFEVDPWFYRPIVDDTPEMRRRAMQRVAASLPVGLRSRFQQGAQMDSGRSRGRFGSSDMEVLSRSGHVHAIASLDGTYRQMTGMTELAITIGVSPLNAQGLSGAGQRVAVIDRTFFPQQLGASLVQEECFCAMGCCAGGATRSSGPGSSFISGLPPETVDHGTAGASIVSFQGTQGFAPGTAIVALAAPGLPDIFSALEWLATRPEIGIVNLSLGTDPKPGVCDGDPGAAPWLSRLSTLANQGKIILAAAGNDSAPGTIIPACTSVATAVGGSWACDSFEPQAGCSPGTIFFDTLWSESARGSKIGLFAPASPLQVPYMGVGAVFRAGTSEATPMVAACAALLKQARPAATRSEVLYALSQSPVSIAYRSNEGAQFNRSNVSRPRLDCQAALAAMPPNVPPPPPNLHQFGISGSWRNPQSPGQGIAIASTPNLIAPGVGFINGGWFTFAPTAGGPESGRWYSLSGTVNDGATSVSLAIHSNTDGNFVAPPETTAQPVGTATLQMLTCDTASFTYSLTDGGSSGVIPLVRTLPNLTCTASGSGGSSHPDYLHTGSYSTPGLGGQGLFLELNPGQPALNIGWFTYARSSIAGGSPRQRWYSLQLPGYIVGASVHTNVPIIQTTGGTLNGSTPVNTNPVGTATVQIGSCNDLTITYDFNAGENAGLSGTLGTVRALPAPPGCQ